MQPNDTPANHQGAENKWMSLKIENYDFLPDEFIASCGFDIVSAVQETCTLEYRPLERGYIYYPKERITP